MTTAYAQAAEKDAADLLARVWSSQDLPVDPVRIAKELGIEAFAAQLDRNVSGALVKKPGRDPVILLNQDDSENRQRFSCAHELGHFVRRSNQMGESEEFEYVDLRGDLASTGLDEDEVYANTFAASLLMPREEVTARVKDGQSVVQMQLVFGVSGDAMENRLSYLGLK